MEFSPHTPAHMKALLLLTSDLVPEHSPTWILNMCPLHPDLNDPLKYLANYSTHITVASSQNRGWVPYAVFPRVLIKTVKFFSCMSGLVGMKNITEPKRGTSICISQNKQMQYVLLMCIVHVCEHVQMQAYVKEGKLQLQYTNTSTSATGWHWPGFDSSRKIPSNWRMLVSLPTVKLISGGKLHAYQPFSVCSPPVSSPQQHTSADMDRSLLFNHCIVDQSSESTTHRWKMSTNDTGLTAGLKLSYTSTLL